MILSTTYMYVLICNMFVYLPYIGISVTILYIIVFIRYSMFYSVSQKNSPLRFSEIFLINFYTPIVRSFLH